MANRSVYICAQDPRHLMCELLEIMHNDEDNNYLSLSCRRAMEKHLVSNLHQSLFPISLLDEIRAADDQAIQRSRQSEAARRNRRDLGETPNAIPRPVPNTGESHMRAPRNITKSFLLTKYDRLVDEAQPAHFKPPPAPSNKRGSSSTDKASSVNTPKENRLPRDVNRAFFIADEDDTSVDESRPVHHKSLPDPLNIRESSSTEKASSVSTTREDVLPRDVNQAFYVADEDEPQTSSPHLLAQTSAEQTLAPIGNRKVLGEISNVISRPVIGPGKSHLRGPLNINQSFYVAEDDETVIDESPPVTEPDESHFGEPVNFNQSFCIVEDDPSDEPPQVHHEPPRAPPNPYAQPSTGQPTRVSKPKANTQQNVRSTLCPTQNDQPYRRIITNANYDAAVTLKELEESFIEETEPADDGSQTEKATEPDSPTDPNTAPAAHVFEEIPKIVVTDSRENIQAIVDAERNEPEQPAEKSTEKPTKTAQEVPEYNFYKQKKAGFYDRAADEPKRLYPSTIVERRDNLPPSWSARSMGKRSQRPPRPACSSPPIQRAGSAPVPATKATEVMMGKGLDTAEPRTTTGKRARGAEPGTAKKRLRKPGGGKKDV
ncbi:hypothetical protein BM1_08729 [Bipolaris maydis]|uniref:uncharacterized protein n=1 Tax=Cochliobolus heterostrophus TaxID=5016 RepID=UPI0024D0621B|nr:hypothetical protein BM1_08729 [Bipolaris maydis]KAJ5025080.1 hypothetical protein J3E73DRAFT_371839 [Bipolaris maydis]KAJ6265207.1 hypothetical protein PSV08DRAFT_357484 [Bipolaris maydis]KAJ6280938.1 hypothetical protein J3E71DRAFT_362335 [Bipolaris maydis]